MRWLVLIVLGSALGIGTSVFVIARGHSEESERPTALQRPAPARRPTHAENRRVLTAPQTRRLVRYATALHACLARRGVEVAPPRKSSQAITLKAASNVGADQLVAEMMPCVAPLGDPPKPSSLQAVDARTIVLSVPKQCVLDPKVEA
jgi:hypothetical protein